MTDTETVRDWWSEYRCNYGTSTNMFGRTPVFAQNTSHVRALEQAHFVAGYYPTPGGYIGSKRVCPSGIGGRKCEDDGRNCSLHNYGLAWDVEYNYNPMMSKPYTTSMLWEAFESGLTKYNPDIVDSIYRVTNLQGEQMFNWKGYSLGDFMHWQLNVPPWRQDVDWDSIPDTGEMMELERWATRLRNPLDFDQMAAKGVITEAERDYWITVATDSAEMQDLRDALEVRGPIWTG